MADPNVQKTSSGASVVRLQQYYQGIPIFQMALTVHFSDRKQLRSATGDNVSIGDGFNVIPSFGVKEAILEVCNYLNANQGLSDAGDQVDGWGQPVKVTPIDVSCYKPKILAVFPMPSRPTVLDKGLFEDYIPANLVIFHQGPQSRLRWHFVITLPNNWGQYVFIVGADADSSGEILYAQEVSVHVAAQGNVFEFNGGHDRDMVPFPRPVEDYPPILTPEEQSDFGDFPDWVDKDQAIGNSTVATLGDSPTTLTGEDIGGLLTFNPDDSTGDD